MHRHGIVFNRLRFSEDPFDERVPSNKAPASEGNVKEIEGMLFLRGRVEAKVGDVEASDLGVRTTVESSRVRLGFKPAAPGTSQGSGFTLFTDPVELGFFSSSIEFDTSKIGVGETDLVVVGENEDGFTDFVLLPTWEGDGNPHVDSDERYLKRLGAWYDEDGDPDTERDGKVIVDNEAPKVKNIKP